MGLLGAEVDQTTAILDVSEAGTTQKRDQDQYIHFTARIFHGITNVLISNVVVPWRPHTDVVKLSEALFEHSACQQPENSLRGSEKSYA